MNEKQRLKAANSKGKLLKACIMYQKALLYYADESHWAVKDDIIQWIADDDPTKVAGIVLGKRKSVRLPDNNKEVSHG